MGELDWENLSYIATVVPIVWGTLYWIFVERRKNREIEEEENRLQLEENYSRLQAGFRKAQYKLIDYPAINHHDRPPEDADLAAQQRLFYEIIISLLEESFIIFYKPEDPDYQRFWNSWDDYIGEVLGWQNFRDNLDDLLDGEDPEFCEYFLQRKRAHTEKYAA